MGNKNKTIADRQQFVVKANDLIRKTRYDLTAQQQKIILFCISKIRPNDDPQTEYEISIDDLCKACNTDLDGGGFYYKAIKNDLRALTNRLWVKMPDNSEQTVSWISDAKIIPLSGKVYITFHKAMSPYLFDLKERYTQYHLEEVLVFKGKHSIRLFELLRSYTTQKAIENGWKQEATFSIDELRNILSITQYRRWADFHKYVIKKAVDEINQYNDKIHVDYTTSRDNGRTVSAIKFTISTAKALQRIDAHKETRRRLESKATRRPG